jgi:hypothetical protein
MPSVITHGIIGYILFGFKGLIISIIPDIIGFGYYFYRMFFIEKTINFNKSVYTWAPIDKMNKLDWFLYNISHSLIFWFLLYYIFKEKFILAAIISIIVDIFLHSKDRWLGPAFLYPLSEYRFDGIHWLSNTGKVISVIIILITYLQKQNILKILSKV